MHHDKQSTVVVLESTIRPDLVYTGAFAIADRLKSIHGGPIITQSLQSHNRYNLELTTTSKSKQNGTLSFLSIVHQHM
jgi:hypothetical protein